MNKAAAWLEDGFHSTYQDAMEHSRRYGDKWIVCSDDTEYTKTFHPLRHTDINNAFYSIKEDSR